MVVASPKIEKSENKLTLSFELTGGTLAEVHAKSGHIFATIAPQKGLPLILHISWTGPESQWRPNMDQLLRLFAVSFLAL